MTARESSRTDQAFEQMVDRLLDGAPREVVETPGTDVATAALVAAVLAPERAPVVGARARVWQRLAPALDQEPAFGWRARWGQALIERRRAVVMGAATAMVACLGLLTPLGQQAVASAQEGFRFTFVRLTPEGPVALSETATRRIGKTIVMVDEMVSVAEAERQAGFPVVQPRDLPREAVLLGAHVVRHQAGTPEEWRSVTLTYEVGDQVLTLTQARDGGRLRVTDSVPAAGARIEFINIATAATTEAPASPMAVTPTPASAMAATLMPLKTRETSVRVGAVEGTLTTIELPDGKVLSRSLTWRVGDTSYGLRGLLDAEVLRRIAASVPASAAGR